MPTAELVVVDASVAVKWYIPERDHESARKLRDGYVNGRYDLIAPAVFPFEVVNGLRYSGQYRGERLVAAAETVVEYGIEYFPFARAGPVTETANRLDLSIYDAAYLALAAANECRVYTADEGLVDRTNGSDLANHIEHITTLD